MGNECSIDSQIILNKLDQDTSDLLKKRTLIIKEDIKKFLTIDSYEEYIYIKTYLITIIDENLNKKQSKTSQIQRNKSILVSRLPFSYSRFINQHSITKLNNIVYSIYIKINSIYKSSYSFPRQELSNITYDLISRYLSYEDNSQNELLNVTTKSIKRLNFFTDDFPQRLRLIRRVFKSKRIYAFGYDCHYRLTFYIRPFFENKNMIKYKKPKPVEYLYYIFFYIEIFQVILIEKYSFSKEVNIYIDFNNNEIDIEFIRIILHFFTSYYPLLLNKICIDKYISTNVVEIYNAHLLFDDPFGCVIFIDQKFKKHVGKFFFDYCLPVDYGGKGNVDFTSVDGIMSMEEFINYCIDMILVSYEYNEI